MKSGGYGGQAVILYPLDRHFVSTVSRTFKARGREKENPPEAGFGQG